MNVPQWHTIQGSEDDWFDVADCGDDGNFSVWMNGAKPPRYGWLRSETVGVLGGWVLLLLAGCGFLWSSGQRHLPLAGICGILMFVGAIVASSVPDGTTIQDTVRYKEGLFREAFKDKGWSRGEMEREFFAIAGSI